MKINETNAYRFSDNYTVETADGLNVFGCEHNHEEAKAVAKWLSSQKGLKVVVKTNGRSEVAEAKQFRSEPMRYECREEALRTMGVWPRN